MKRDLKLLLKYILFPLMIPVWILAAISMVVSMLLWMADLDTMSEYPTLPFWWIHDQWAKLGQE